jgi:hypothetical protein
MTPFIRNRTPNTKRFCPPHAHRYAPRPSRLGLAAGFQADTWIVCTISPTRWPLLGVRPAARDFEASAALDQCLQLGRPGGKRAGKDGQKSNLERVSGIDQPWIITIGSSFVDPSQIIMGVLIGYHTVKTRGEEIEVPRLQETEIIYAESEGRDEKDDLKWADENKTGFGVVIPMHFIFSAFESEQMRKILEKSVNEFRQTLGYRDASAGFFSQIAPSDAGR